MRPISRGSRADQRAVGLVVGLPLHADGRESDKSREARAFGAWLAQSAQTAGRLLGRAVHDRAGGRCPLAAKLNHKKRRDRRDRVAAQMILQNYIDAGSPPEGTSPLHPVDGPIIE